MLPRQAADRGLPVSTGSKLKKLFYRPVIVKRNFCYRLVKILLLVATLDQGLHSAPMAHAARTYTDEDLKREEREAREAQGLRPRRTAPLRSMITSGITSGIGCNCGNASQDVGADNIKISFTIAGAFTAFFYNQVTPNNIITAFSGFLQGVATNLKLTFYPRYFGFIVVPFDFALYGGAELRYESNVGHVNPSTTAHTDSALIVEVRSLVGPTVFFANHYRATILVGAGYKYTRNNTMDDRQYYRRRQYFYLPLAAQFEYSEGAFSILLHGEYDVFINAINSGNLRNFVPIPDSGGQYEYAYINFRGGQPGGYGARGYIELKIDNFSITPFFNYLWISTAELDRGEYIGAQTGLSYGGIYFLRTDSSTIETGLKLGYQF